MSADWLSLEAHPAREESDVSLNFSSALTASGLVILSVVWMNGGEGRNRTNLGKDHLSTTVLKTAGATRRPSLSSPDPYGFG